MTEPAAAPAAEPVAIPSQVPAPSSGKSAAAPEPAPGPAAIPAKDAAPAAPDPVAEPEIKPYWPEDWKEHIAKGNEKDMKRLARLGSPEQIMRSLLELERKHQSGMYRATLAEDADDAAKAEFRKSWGIPDKPEGYGIEFPKTEGYEPSDADKADLNTFLKAAHDNHAEPRVVKALVDQYWAMQTRSQQQMADAALEATINRRSELKSEWGKEFERNSRLGNADLTGILGDEKAKGLANTVLADGTRLGDHPDFARYVVAAAKRNADDMVLAMPDMSSGTGAGGLDAAYTAAKDLAFTDPKTYHSQAHQDKLMRLAGAVAQRSDKTARPQAA